MVIPSVVNGLPVTTIGLSAFYHCASVTSITIPDGVTNIGDYAFGACASLTNVTIGNGVTSIGDGTFEGCSSLTGITMPNSITSIGSSAFYGCASLTGITIPDSVTSIGESAFEFCTSLTSATIGRGVTNIWDYAFAFTSLATVGFRGNAPIADSPVFDGDGTATVYYLPGTTGWGPTLGGRPTVLWNPQVQPGSLGVRTNQFGFSLTGGSNQVVVIEAATNLANPTWYPLATNTLTGGLSYFSDPQWTNYGGRFYRVTWP